MELFAMSIHQCWPLRLFLKLKLFELQLSCSQPILGLKSSLTKLFFLEQPLLSKQTGHGRHFNALYLKVKGIISLYKFLEFSIAAMEKKVPFSIYVSVLLANGIKLRVLS